MGNKGGILQREIADINYFCPLLKVEVNTEWWYLDNRYLSCQGCGTVLTGDHKHIKLDYRINVLQESEVKE
jgi:hypothetical protein